MKKILITGGAGFIGSHTAVEIISAGYEPIVVDNFINSEKFIIDGIEEITGFKPVVHEGDCCDESFMNKVFEMEKPDGVIHFAAYKAVGESVKEPLKYYENNLESLLVLLKTMSNHSCELLVFSSSCTVYGEPDSLPVTESSPVKKAASPYGNTKQIAEEIISDYCESGKNLKAISLRYFNPIGAHPSSIIGELPIGIPNNLIPFITQTAIGLREELTVFGDDYDTPDGSCIRDYIHVVDLAKAHLKALEYLYKKAPTPYYDVFNVGTGNGNSVLEVINKFKEATGSPLNYTIGGRREGDIEKIYADVEKAEATLDWKAEKNLESALKDAWNWQLRLKKNGKQ